MFAYYVCLVFCILPHDTDPARLDRVYNSKLFTMVTYYGLRHVLLLTLLVCGSYCLYTDMSHYSHDQTMLQLTMLIVAFVEVASCDIFAITSTAGWPSRFLRYKHRLVTKLAQIDTKLPRSPISTATFTFTRVLSVILHVYAIVFLVDMFIWYQMIGYNIIFYIPVYCYKFSIVLFAVQFSMTVSHLGECLRKLNQVLENFYIAVDSSFARKRMNTVANGRLNVNVLPDVSPLTIWSVREIHWQLHSAVHTTNGIFGSQLLAASLCIFVHLIVSPYFMLLDIIYPPSSGWFYAGYMIIQALWVLLHIIELNLLLLPCALISKRGMKTSSTVCKLLNKEMALESKKQLQTFAAHLMHYKVELSANGLFRLDSPVIVAVAGAVTAYLVILIQFQNLDSSYARQI